MRVVVRCNQLAGYLMSRPGANAVQVGPSIAHDDAGAELLADTWLRYAGQRVFIDVPDANQAAIAAVTEAGLTVQRRFVRMSRGPGLADCPRKSSQTELRLDVDQFLHHAATIAAIVPLPDVAVFGAVPSRPLLDCPQLGIVAAIHASEGKTGRVMAQLGFRMITLAAAAYAHHTYVKA